MRTLAARWDSRILLWAFVFAYLLDVLSFGLLLVSPARVVGDYMVQAVESNQIVLRLMAIGGLALVFALKVAAFILLLVASHVQTSYFWRYLLLTSALFVALLGAVSNLRAITSV